MSIHSLIVDYNNNHLLPHGYIYSHENKEGIESTIIFHIFYLMSYPWHSLHCSAPSYKNRKIYIYERHPTEGATYGWALNTVPPTGGHPTEVCHPRLGTKLRVTPTGGHQLRVPPTVGTNGGNKATFNTPWRPNSENGCLNVSHAAHLHRMIECNVNRLCVCVERFVCVLSSAPLHTSGWRGLIMFMHWI